MLRNAQDWLSVCTAWKHDMIMICETLWPYACICNKQNNEDMNTASYCTPMAFWLQYDLLEFEISPLNLSQLKTFFTGLLTLISLELRVFSVLSGHIECHANYVKFQYIKLLFYWNLIPPQWLSSIVRKPWTSCSYFSFLLCRFVRTGSM